MQKLKNLLLEEHSKSQKDKIIHAISDGSIPLSDLIQIIKNNEETYAQRAAYVLSGIHDSSPDRLKPYLKELWLCIKPTNHPAIPRAIYRYLASIDLPFDLEDGVFNQGCQTFRNQKTPIAIKVHLMKILTNIALKYPELKEDVIYLIQEQHPFSSPGYRAAAKKALINLSKSSIDKKE